MLPAASPIATAMGAGPLGLTLNFTLAVAGIGKLQERFIGRRPVIFCYSTVNETSLFARLPVEMFRIRPCFRFRFMNHTVVVMWRHIKCVELH